MWLGCTEPTGEVFPSLHTAWSSMWDFKLQRDHRHLATCLYRFLDDIEAMLGWRPSVIYKYLWKYICLLAMLGLLGATTIKMFIKYPTYIAWNEEKVQRICFSDGCGGCACFFFLHGICHIRAKVGFQTAGESYPTIHSFFAIIQIGCVSV